MSARHSLRGTVTGLVLQSLLLAWAPTAPAAQAAGDGEPRGYAVDLMGSAPEEVILTIDTPKHGGVSIAALQLGGVYDADIADEGELLVNGHSLRLFRDRRGGAAKEVDITLATPASWWQDGVNTLIFRHTRTAGYRIREVSVSYEAAGSALPAPGNRVPARFPMHPDQWGVRCGTGWPPYPGEPMTVAYDDVSGMWQTMGHIWNTNDPANPRYEIIERPYVFVSADGLNNWQAAGNNPVMEYDGQFPVRDHDYYVNLPAYARNPDSSFTNYLGRRVVAVVNFDGRDSHIQTLLSADGIAWAERTTLWSGDKTRTPPGSDDQGEQWVNSFIHNPDDGKWYLFYNGGGGNQHSTGSSTRTVGVAIGSTPQRMIPWQGAFSDGDYITQSPKVLRDATGWLMVYIHGTKDDDGLWLARSPDLKHWTPAGRFMEGDILLQDIVAITGQETVSWRIYGRHNGRKCVFTATVPREE